MTVSAMVTVMVITVMTMTAMLIGKRRMVMIESDGNEDGDVGDDC